MSRATTRHSRSLGPLVAVASSTSGTASSTPTASLEAALRDLQEDERHQRVAHPVRVELGAEAADHAALGELRQPRLHRSAGDLQPARDLHEADARLVAKQTDEPGVELIHRTGHIV